MTKRQIAIYLLLLFCSSLAVIWGIALARSARGIMLDYRVVYIGARCLMHHCDPYNEAQLMQVYFEEGGERLPAPKPGQTQQYLAAQQLYPPTAELFFAPFAIPGWKTSYVLWILCTVLLVTTAAYLVCEAGQRYAQGPPFYLACIVLINSGIVFSGANPAGLAVALCIIGVCCILQNRAPKIGVICLAASLVIKPHDVGFVWLYLLLLGGTYRRAARQTLVILAILAAISIAWISSVSFYWLHEIRSNLAIYLSVGVTNDLVGGTSSMMVNLQPLFAAFRNDPVFYNLCTYVILAPFLLAWALVTRRASRLTSEGIWLGLAAIATLSLLPVYHRPHDAKILLLTLPACAVLYAQRGVMALMGLMFTTAGIAITSDLPLAALNLANAAPQPGPFSISRTLRVFAGHPIGIVLLAVSAFYVGVFVMHCRLEFQKSDRESL